MVKFCYVLRSGHSSEAGQRQDHIIGVECCYRVSRIETC